VNVLDLFSGIGGFSLGLERAGMRTVAFCEIEPFARRVLAKHWPNVPCYTDVRELSGGRIAADGISVDVICGGFPCQDISVAGKGAGLEGARSGLWFEYARIIGEVRPRHVIVENVSALLHRGLDRVLGDLAALGYDAEWHCIPASAIGAPHRRDRIWIVADASGDGGRPNAARHRLPTEQEKLQSKDRETRSNNHTALRGDVADAIGSRQPQPKGRITDQRRRPINGGKEVSLADTNASNEQWWGGSLQMGWGRIARQIADDGEFGRTQWSSEPDVGRVAHGVPSRVDRLGGLGNAVVPQIPEIIGRAIMKAAE
jgi:DNA (cytosine-5)-methyltransferase 1